MLIFGEDDIEEQGWGFQWDGVDSRPVGWGKGQAFEERNPQEGGRSGQVEAGGDDTQTAGSERRNRGEATAGRKQAGSGQGDRRVLCWCALLGGGEGETEEEGGGSCPTEVEVGDLWVGWGGRGWWGWGGWGEKAQYRNHHLQLCDWGDYRTWGWKYQENPRGFSGVNFENPILRTNSLSSGHSWDDQRMQWKWWAAYHLIRHRQAGWLWIGNFGERSDSEILEKHVKSWHFLRWDMRDWWLMMWSRAKGDQGVIRATAGIRLGIKFNECDTFNQKCRISPPPYLSLRKNLFSCLS